MFYDDADTTANDDNVRCYFTARLSRSCVFFFVRPPRQGHMVARGSYSELQGCGLDFASLLKEDEDGPEEERPEAPVARCTRALSHHSVSSMSSLSSSRHSLTDEAAVRLAAHPDMFQKTNNFEAFFF